MHALTLQVLFWEYIVYRDAWCRTHERPIDVTVNERPVDVDTVGEVEPFSQTGNEQREPQTTPTHNEHHAHASWLQYQSINQLLIVMSRNHLLTQRLYKYHPTPRTTPKPPPTPTTQAKAKHVVGETRVVQNGQVDSQLTTNIIRWFLRYSIRTTNAP